MDLGAFRLGNSVKKVEEYLQQAAECRAMAQATGLAGAREQLEEMAKTWEQLAEVRRHELTKRSNDLP